MTRTTRLVRRAAVTVAALCVTLAVAACGTPEAGAAALVGGRRISVAELQRGTADIQAYYEGQEVAQQQVLFFLISGPFIVDAAAKAGIGVSVNDARTTLDDKIVSPSEPGIAVFQANQALLRIGQLEQAKRDGVLAAIKASLGDAKVTVNPRYGTFDDTKLTIVPTIQNWIASSSATPAPVPSPSAS